MRATIYPCTPNLICLPSPGLLGCAGNLLTKRTYFEMPERIPDKNWHLDKRVSIGQILTLLSIVGALIWQWSSFDKRLTVVETNQNNNNQRILSILETQASIDTRQDQDILQLKIDTREDYRAIDSKLDRLIERL